MPAKLTFTVIALLAAALAGTMLVAIREPSSSLAKIPLIAFSGTILTVTVTVFGWYAAHVYAKQKDDRARKFEIHLKYRAQQIGEFYGPLASLIQQVFNVYEVREKILEYSEFSDADAERVRRFVWQRYFRPLHAEIASLLRTKLYLLDEAEMPKSFQAYLQHSMQEECQHLLGSELSLDTSKVPPSEWPEKFDRDVNKRLAKLMEEYKSGVVQD